MNGTCVLCTVNVEVGAKGVNTCCFVGLTVVFGVCFVVAVARGVVVTVTDNIYMFFV